MRLWDFHFSDYGFNLLTPLFSFVYSFGDKKYDRNVFWWGFKLYYSINPDLKEGSFIFLKEKGICFREYSYYKYLEIGKIQPI